MNVSKIYFGWYFLPPYSQTNHSNMYPMNNIEICVQWIVIGTFYFFHLTVGPTREVCVSLPDPRPPLVIHWRQQDEGKDRIWRFHPWYHHHPSTTSTDYTYHRLWGEFSSMMTFNYWYKVINWFGNMQFLIYNYWILVIKNSLFHVLYYSYQNHGKWSTYVSKCTKSKACGSNIAFNRAENTFPRIFFSIRFHVEVENVT